MKTLFEGGPNRLVLLIFLAIALYACYWLVKPFMQPIILAILIGMLSFPLICGWSGLCAGDIRWQL